MASQRRTKPRPTRRVKSATSEPVRRRVPRPSIPKFDPNDKLGPAYWLGSRLSRFRDLTSHPMFQQIHGRLISGMAAHRVALWLQRQVDPDDPLGANSLQMLSLARKLQRYGRLLPKAHFLPQGVIEKLVNEAELEIDVMQDLAALIMYQRQRLELAHRLEQQMQVPMESVRHEVQVYGDLLRQMRDTQISLGYVPGMLAPTGGTTINVGGAVVLGDSGLERMLAEHPEMVGEVMPALKALEDLKLERATDVTPKEETDDTGRSSDGGQDRPPGDE